jgi:hypothetical protein
VSHGWPETSLQLLSARAVNHWRAWSFDEALSIQSLLAGGLRRWRSSLFFEMFSGAAAALLVSAQATRRSAYLQGALTTAKRRRRVHVLSYIAPDDWNVLCGAHQWLPNLGPSGLA